MLSSRLIRKRIISARNIAKLTRAMEMVAASKMKRAQSLAVSGKPYAQKIYQAVYDLAKRIDTKFSPLLRRNILSNKILVILISTNKGLCGGLNANLFRFCLKEFSDKQIYDFVAVGKKGESFIARSGFPLVVSFSQKQKFTEDVSAIISFVTSEFMNNRYKEVFIVFSEFQSALVQVPVKKQLLPIGVVPTEEEITTEYFSEFIIEPNFKDLLDAILPHYLENQLRFAILSAEASEHSARMLAMKNATDNASELMADLTLEYNKARQEKITFEIADMVTARMAQE